MQELLDLPLFEARHRELAPQLVDFAAREIAPRAARADTEEPTRTGRELVEVLAGAELLPLVVPYEFRTDPPPRQQGMDLRALCLAREALAGASLFADSVFATIGLGCYPIILAGDDRLKRTYLPRIASGEGISAFALTEPDAGSDISGIQTTATLEEGGYVLDGRKTLISNADIATFFVVFARERAGEMAESGRRPVISAFVVDADTPGVLVRPMAMLAPQPIGEITLKGCRVRASRRLGGAGDGFALALSTLDFFRSSLGAAACGLADRALREALTHARTRRLFGGTLSDLQATRFALADMAVELDAARLLVYRAAWRQDQGADVRLEAAMAKLHATEAAQRIVDQAVQLHGGGGLAKGAVVERLYREVRSLRIYEGASEIQRLVIADQLLERAQN